MPIKSEGSVGRVRSGVTGAVLLPTSRVTVPPGATVVDSLVSSSYSSSQKRQMLRSEDKIARLQSEPWMTQVPICDLEAISASSGSTDTQFVDFASLQQKFRNLNETSVEKETSLLSWLLDAGTGSSEAMLNLKAGSAGIHSSMIKSGIQGKSALPNSVPMYVL